MGDVDTVINSVQSNAPEHRRLRGQRRDGRRDLLVNLVLALVLCFFYLKDGPKWVPWLSGQAGPRAAPHVAALSLKTWTTLSGFIRQQALVGFVDAFFIGLGLLILGVPLVLPLAVLTFFGAFIPIIGAFVTGAFAVLVALVSWASPRRSSCWRSWSPSSSSRATCCSRSSRAVGSTCTRPW